MTMSTGYGLQQGIYALNGIMSNQRIMQQIELHAWELHLRTCVLEANGWVVRLS